MERDDEAYIHYQECITSLNSAWQTLGKLEELSVHPVLRSASYHMALIDYAKPFTKSYGKDGRTHQLRVPSLLLDEEKSLHHDLMKLRNKFLAHSDLNEKDAKVYVGRIGNEPLPLIVSNTDPLMPKPAHVRQLIERALDILYQELPIYFQRFKT